MRRLTQVSIANVKGIESLTFDVGTLTIISGDNATGKTSVLDALRSVFQGGHHPELIRQGQDKSEVILTLDDGLQIKRTITQKGAYLSVVTQDGKPVNKTEQAFVEQLAAGVALDPIEFVNSTPKQQLAFLLSVLPVEFTAAEMQAATGQNDYGPSAVLKLVDLDAARKRIYDVRTERNREVASITGTIKTLSAGLADVPSHDPTQDAAKARERKASLESNIASVGRELESEADAARAKAKADYQERLAAIDKNLKTALETETAELQAGLSAAAAEAAKLDSDARAYHQAEATRSSIEKFKAKLAAEEAEALALTESLRNLDALKLAKLAEAGIDGMEIRPDGLFCDGIAFHELNTQAQYFWAIKIAKMGARELGFMVMDHAEAIVGEQWEMLQAAIEQSGFQVALARAEAGQPLQVISGGIVATQGAKPAAAPKRTRKPKTDDGPDGGRFPLADEATS